MCNVRTINMDANWGFSEKVVVPPVTSAAEFWFKVGDIQTRYYGYEVSTRYVGCDQDGYSEVRC